MKVVALISGGKDSCFNIMQCIAAGHEVVALANLQPYTHNEIDSYMYQSVGHEAIELIAESMQLPLYRQQTKGKSNHLDLTYIPSEHDEVEDLFALLTKVKNDLFVEAVSVGAILSDYQRNRVENVCTRLGIISLAYLWQRNQNDLLQEMIKCEVDAIIIKVAALGLEPNRHLGRSLRLVEPHLQVMHQKYGLHICGEGGEYETLVVDCPLYSCRIVIEESELVLHSDDSIAPVGYLKLNKLKLERKLPQLNLYDRLLNIPLKDSDGYITDPGEEAEEFVDDIILDESLHCNSSSDEGLCSFNFEHTVSCAKSNDGWLWIGGLTGKSTDYEESMKEALELLKYNLEINDQKMEDICSVCLYVSDISKFSELNKLYVQVLNHVNPPSRACVEVPLPKSCPIILEALSWSPSVCATGDSVIEKCTLHVQSISHWAPANIGPYSQAVRVGDFVYLAGQIGLVPGSMQLVNGGIKYQCHIVLRHIDRILNVIDSSTNLRDVVQGICYVTNIKYISNSRKFWEAKTNNAIVNYVVVSNLPKNALVEWHVWAHKHNNTFEYEETGKCIEDWLVSIYRRWNYENNTGAVVCHLEYSKDSCNAFNSVIFEESLKYIIDKLQLGHDSDETSVCNLRIFYNVYKKIPVEEIMKILDASRQTTKIVYTLVPVVSLYSKHTYLSVCGIRIQ